MEAYQCPGVYVEEAVSQSLSISTGSSAVPVILAPQVQGAPFQSGATKITTWLDFKKIIDANTGSQDSLSTLCAAVKAYFANGGGYCYIVAAQNLTTEVPKLDDVTLLVEAGVEASGIRSEMLTLCETHTGMFAIFDGPKIALNAGDWPMAEYDQTDKAAVYYPWLRSGGEDVPPSAAVAGAYCATDRERGVWKAPANITLKGGLQPQFKVSDAIQAQFSANQALNIIREFKDRGTVIWGARTSVLENDLEWRYVPVRRLFSQVEKDIKNTLKSLVFEPNNAMTWERVRSAIDNYLRALWQQGALLGGSEKEAYFVRIGKGLTMTSDDINQGKMIVQVGMAAVRPAEFIILQFSQDIA